MGGSASSTLAAQPQQKQWGYMEKKSNKGMLSFTSSKWRTRACVLSTNTLEYYDISKSGVKTFKNTLLLTDMISWSYDTQVVISKGRPQENPSRIEMQFLQRSFAGNSTVTYYFQRTDNRGPTQPELFPDATYTDDILDDLYQFLTNEQTNKLLIFGCKYKKNNGSKHVRPLSQMFGYVLYTSTDMESNGNLPLAQFLSTYTIVEACPHTGKLFLKERKDRKHIALLDNPAILTRGGA